MSTTESTAPPAKTKRDRRWWADWVSRLVAVTVLIGGLVVVAWPYAGEGTLLHDDPDGRRTLTTTVTKSSTAEPSRSETVATPRDGAATTTTAVTSKGLETERTTTVSEADDSLLERALSGSGLLFLQLGLVFVAAFLAGGITQRVWMGSFGIKLPFVEFADLPAAAAASTEAIDEVKHGLNEQVQTLAGKMNERFETQSETTAKVLEAVANVSRELSDLGERVERLER